MNCKEHTKYVWYLISWKLSIRRGVQKKFQTIISNKCTGQWFEHITTKTSKSNWNTHLYIQISLGIASVKDQCLGMAQLEPRYESNWLCSKRDLEHFWKGGGMLGVCVKMWQDDSLLPRNTECGNKIKTCLNKVEGVYTYAIRLLYYFCLFFSLNCFWVCLTLFICIACFFTLKWEFWHDLS